jgi:formate dehydrogenase (coenzyme F420) beta subunit
MKDQINEYVGKLLDEGKIDGFLAMRHRDGHVEPYLFTDPGDLEQLCLGDLEKSGEVRYPVMKVLSWLFSQNPAGTYAVLVRGCEERQFDKLVQASQLSRRRVVLVGIPCPEELAQEHGCLKPFPDSLIAGSKPVMAEAGKVVTATPRNLIRDMNFLRDISDRCMKCYGCRNICPVCFCKECTLEEDIFVPKSKLGPPPANPDFLLTRAIHMVGYCTYCGLCEEACPADIPLKTLYKMVANIMNEQHGYQMQGLPPRGDEKDKGEQKEAV